MPKNKYLTHPIVIGIITVRLLTAVYILINPFWGTISYFLADFFDGFFSFGTRFLTLPTPVYHKIDKILDQVGSVSMLIAGWIFGFFYPLLLLFIFRFIGIYLFLRTKKRYYLVLFPNFFEPLFFFAVALKSIGIILPGSDINFWLFWILIFGLQLFRDFYLHIIGPKYVYNQLHNYSMLKGFTPHEDA